MPYGKASQQPTRRSPREESGKEDDAEIELDPTAREDTLSPLYSASSAGAASCSTSVSSSQLEMILAANSKAMESSMMSILASMTTPASASSMAPTPAVAPRPQVKVPKWTDGDQPFAFFTKLETALTHNGVDKATWGRLLPVYLSGEAEAAFVQVDRSLLGDFDAVKNILLKALGDTPGHADRRWWSLTRLPGETPAQFFLRIKNTGMRRLSAFPTREAVVEHTILSRFLSLLPADSYAAVAGQHPKTGMDAAELLQDFEETKAYSWKRQGWKNRHEEKNSHHSGRREPGRGGSSNNTSSSSNGGTGNSSTSSSGSSSGVKEGTSGHNPSSSESSSSRGWDDRHAKRSIICHNCGEPGHIRPNCPNRVRSMKSPESKELIEVPGFLAGVPVEGLAIDTGACRTVVDAKHIPQSAYLGKSIVLDSWRGKELSRHRLAKISIKVEDVCADVVVAVAEAGELDGPALLGRKVGPALYAKLCAIVAAKANAALIASEIEEVPMHIVNTEVTKQLPTEVVGVTRAQSEKARKEEVANELASANSGSESLALSDIFDFDDQFFEEDLTLPDPDVSPIPLHEVEGVVNDGVPKQNVGRVNRAQPKQVATVKQAKDVAPTQAEHLHHVVETFGWPVYSLEPDKATDALVQPVSFSKEWPQVVNVEVDEVVGGVKFEVPMQEVKFEVPMQEVKVEVPMEEVKVEVPVVFEPEDASELPAVAFEFESEDASEAPTVAFEDIFPFSDSLFEPEDAGDAPAVVMNDIFSLSVFPFGPDLGEVEFSLPEMTDVSDKVLEVLEAGVASVHCDSVVVPRQEEVKVLEVEEAGVASVKCDTFVVPRQKEVKVLEVVEAGVAPVICANIVVPMQQFFVNDQADVEASGPVDDKPMVGQDVLNLMDGFPETDLVLVSVPVARPDPESVVKPVILAMEVGIAPNLCRQSPAVLVNHCLRCAGCISKATRKIAPGSCAFILIFDVFTLVISSIFSFCACISICRSKFLVVLFFGAFGPRTVFCTPWGKLVHAAMPVVLRNGPAVMDLVLHLTETTRKSSPERVAWNEALECEFVYLKNCICSAPCLTLPVVGDVVLLQTDTLSRMFPEDPPSRMPDAPAAYEGPPAVVPPVSSTTEGGGDVMESPSLAAAAHNI